MDTESVVSSCSDNDRRSRDMSAKITKHTENHRLHNTHLQAGARDPEALCPYNVYKRRETDTRPGNTCHSFQEKEITNKMEFDSDTNINMVRGLLDAEALCPYNVYKAKNRNLHKPTNTIITTIAKFPLEHKKSNSSKSLKSLIMGTFDAEALCPFNIYKNRSTKN